MRQAWAAPMFFVRILLLAFTFSPRFITMLVKPGNEA